MHCKIEMVAADGSLKTLATALTAANPADMLKGSRPLTVFAATPVGAADVATDNGVMLPSPQCWCTSDHG